MAQDQDHAFLARSKAISEVDCMQIAFAALRHGLASQAAGTI